MSVPRAQEMIQMYMWFGYQNIAFSQWREFAHRIDERIFRCLRFSDVSSGKGKVDSQVRRFFPLSKIEFVSPPWIRNQVAFRLISFPERALGDLNEVKAGDEARIRDPQKCMRNALKFFSYTR